MTDTSLTRRFFSTLGRGIDALSRLFGRLLFLLILVILITLIVSRPGPVTIASGSVLVLDPSGTLVEQDMLADPFSLLLGGGGLSVTLLSDITKTLQRAAGDNRISALVLRLDDLLAVSPAHLETVSQALSTFKESGKPIFAHGDYYGQQQYLLASHADAVSMHPMGSLLLPGYGGTQLFFAGLLEKLKVNIHVFRAGTHKSAAEPFVLDALSPEARANNQELVDELWLRYLERIAINRQLSMESLRNYTDNTAPLVQEVAGDMARLALEQGLIDEVLNDSEFQQSILARLNSNNDNYPQIDFRDYLFATDRPEHFSSPQIGIIVAQGTILMGDQPLGYIGADTLNDLIRHARFDDDIKAVVLRVDSPGGVALASEQIREELALLSAVGKPLVVSMSGTAASGGYWIATAADEIWASPATVTGSIGVIGMFPTIEDSLAEIGITSDGVSTTPLSRAGDPFNAMNESMQQIMQASVEDTYRRFLNLVATSRSMTVEAVDAVAQGQVWTGNRAQQLGLVDGLGEIEDAVTAAARLAGLDEYQLRYIEHDLSASEQLMRQFLSNFSFVSTARNALGIANTNTNSGTSLWRQLQTSMLLNNIGRGEQFLLCEFCSSLQ